MLTRTDTKARGLADLTLHLNSIGDEVCRPAYRERLIAYLASDTVTAAINKSGMERPKRQSTR